MPENIDAVTNLSRLDIMQVQARLSALGYDVGRPDGIWGAKTRDSIKAWQGTQGFNVTGELTKHQLDELRVIR
jgi:peptidoglycan hydrolase-like protein with peptidoglycan-binding domain